MSPPAIALLAFGLSVDAMIASMGGAGLRRLSPWVAALRSGLCFGGVAALLALIGWSIGHEAGESFAAVDHWIAFVLLALVGGRMFMGGETKVMTGGTALLFASFGASIDALAAGASLALLSVPILPVVIAIGIASFAMSAAGVMAAGALKRVFGPRFESWAEWIGGAALIGLGICILLNHLII